MRNKCVQMSLYDTYKGIAASMEEDKPKLFRLLDEHIDWDTIVPARFYMAFYQKVGRPRKYPLAAFLKSLVLQKIFGYVNDSVLLVTLRHSREMRDFCGFEKVPDAAKLTRFKQDFLPYIVKELAREHAAAYRYGIPVRVSIFVCQAHAPQTVSGGIVKGALRPSALIHGVHLPRGIKIA